MEFIGKLDYQLEHRQTGRHYLRMHLFRMRDIVCECIYSEMENIFRLCQHRPEEVDYLADITEASGFGLSGCEKIETCLGKAVQATDILASCA